MRELWEQAILPYNLPLTILLGMMVLYWLRALAGFGDDLDDLDGDGEPDAHGGDSLLRIVNAGAVPLTIILSILLLALWMGSMALNYYFNPGHSLWRAAGLDAGALVLAVIATKVITQPLVPLMRRLKNAENAAPVIGETGVVRSIEIDPTYGQVEVARPHGAPALLNAKLSPGSEPLPRGTPVAIESIDQAGIYLVRALP